MNTKIVIDKATELLNSEAERITVKHIEDVAIEDIDVIQSL